MPDAASDQGVAFYHQNVRARALEEAGDLAARVASRHVDAHPQIIVLELQSQIAEPTGCRPFCQWLVIEQAVHEQSLAQLRHDV